MCSRARGGAGWRIVAGSGLLALAVAADPSSGVGRALPAALDAGSRLIGVTKESAGVVTLALTPTRFADQRLVVDIAVTTHTVDHLDRYDLKKIVALLVDGKSIAPSSAPGLRGHHNRGQLVFPLETLPSSLAVEIHGLGEPGVRILRWP